MDFYDIVLSLHKFWKNHGCLVILPYDIEVGAGTFHPETVFRSLGTKSWKTSYVQPCRRPSDGRYGTNCNRLQKYYQYKKLFGSRIGARVSEIRKNSISKIRYRMIEQNFSLVGGGSLIYLPS